MNRTRNRTWISYGIATKVAPNKAGRQIDDNDEQVAREAKALRTARGLAPARTRRYEDHEGADVLHDLIHGRR